MSFSSSESLSSGASFKSAKSQDGLPSQSAQFSSSYQAGPGPSQPRPQSTTSRSAHPANSAYSIAHIAAADRDDWGSFELSDEDTPTQAFTTGRLGSNPPTASITGGNGDSLRLRSYGEPNTHAGVLESDSQPPPSLIGIYADPAAKKDDWADDFEFETRDADQVHRSPFLEPVHDTIGSTSWPLPRDSPVINSEVFSRLNIPHLDIGASASLPPSAAQHRLNLENVADQVYEPGATTGVSSAHGDIPSVIGYEAEEVHQSCAHLKELFGRHSISIQQHVDEVIGELGNLAVLDQKVMSLHLFSADAEVAKLAQAHQDAAPHILEWKLELALLTNDEFAAAKAMLGLAQYASRSGDVEASQKWLDKVSARASSFDKSSISISLAIESDYEGALNQRHSGNLDGANQILYGAISKCKVLADQSKHPDDDIAPEQRAIWWSLRSKYLLAEICLQQGQKPTAIQLYAEYSFECIARMIGLAGSPTQEQGLSWYFLFSPVSLVHAIWSCTCCLFDIRAYSPAGDMAAVVMHAATLFGNKDINDSAADLRARVKMALREYKRQQAARLTTESSATCSMDVGRLPVPNRSHELTGTRCSQVEDDFEGSVESEGDWDRTLEKVLNVTIVRCSEGTALDGCTGNTEHMTNLPSQTDENSFVSVAGNSTATPKLPASVHTNHFAIYQRSGSTDLMEGQLQLYLNRIHSAAASLSAHQLYPQPTVPFERPVLGVKEHEAFLRNFVRGKDPRFLNSHRSGGTVGPVWDPRISIDLQRRHPMKLFRAKSQYVDRLSSRWALLVLETVWKILRGEGMIEEKRANVRTLVQATIREATDLATRVPVMDEHERMERLDMLAGLLEALRLSREILTYDGQEAIWFSRACSLLGKMASTVKPAAKAAVELFQAESRAHCGVTAVTPRADIIMCSEIGNRSEMDARPSDNRPPVSDIASSLRHSVVDILHGLFWRTKSGFDENSEANSFERLVHADVASTLFLTGSGISPVDGSRINVEKDEALLNLHKRGIGIENYADQVVDETRRVKVADLVQELKAMWESPSLAAAVRAKVSFALALHSNAEPHDYGRTERFLFDGLQSIHSVSGSMKGPVSFFSTLTRVSPIGAVSSPLSNAMLQAYGNLTLQHSKYQYGIAALEAATDSRRVRDLKNDFSLTTATEVATAALSKGDWRRALVLLHDLRSVVHPKDGKRNDFMQLCLLIHKICMDVGCFAASIVPLRAFSALIYEERLRVLLLRYRRRLARKSRNRQRLHLAASPLPTVMSKAPYLKAQSASLAMLFESPLRTSGVALDGSFMRTPTTSDARNRPTTPTPPDRPTEPLKFSRTPAWLPSAKSFSSKNESPTQTSDTGKQDDGRSEVSGSRRSSRSERSSKRFLRKKNQKSSAVAKKRPRAKPHHFVEEQKELLRIEAEQELVADVERFQVEFLLITTAYAAGNFSDADMRCRGLLEMKMPHSLRYKVCEVRARIALKRREISRCLELIDSMEREFRNGFQDGSNSELAELHQRLGTGKSPFHGNDDSSKTVGSDGVPVSPKLFIPTVAFLRLSSLLHGGRLEEGLSLADEALKVCPETELWNRARLHYLRGKFLYGISSVSTAPFDRGEGLPFGARPNVSPLDLQSITLTLSAFETASRYYDAAGDELGMLKSDLKWARTCIDTLFRRVVLPKESGGGIPLDQACSLGDRTISPPEVEDAIHHLLDVASTANLPLLLIDALAALAEIKCVRGESASSWNVWVAQSWRLFSRLLTDSEDFTVVLTAVAPVSTLIRLRKLCGRLVRLVLSGPKAEDVSAMNRHLHMFEAYVTLQVDIDRRMSLAPNSSRKFESKNEASTGTETANASSGKQSEDDKQSIFSKYDSVPDDSVNKSNGFHDRFTAAKTNYGHKKPRESVGSRNSETTRRDTSNRPAGAFLHMLEKEGAALGRLGLSLFINRPRKHVISAVRETGAVLIPSNFFTNSRAQEKANSHVLGKDAELIFPFKDKLGLGAMQILDGPRRKTLCMNSLSPSPEIRNTASNQQTADESNLLNDDTEDVVPEVMDSNGQDHNVHIQRISFLEPDGSHWEGGNGHSALLDEDTPPLRFRAPREESIDMQLDNVDDNPIDGLSEDPLSAEEAANESRIRFESSSMPSELVDLVESIRAADNAGGRQIPATVFGGTPAERVWAHFHRIKAETRRYVHGELTIEELGNRNREALQSWLLCLPRCNKEWTVPESIAKRLVYVLFAHGVLGYYVVNRGGCIGGVAFGGKQSQTSPNAPGIVPPGISNKHNSPRPILDTERIYLYNLVKDWKRSTGWNKDRDSGIINGLANSVLRAPRTLLAPHSQSHRTKGRPILLIADSSVQVIPWELFFDHVVIRSLSLLDIIRGVQENSAVSMQSPMAYNAMVSPNSPSNRSITRIICFTTTRRESADKLRTEEARRQHLAFQSLLRMNHLNAPALISKLSLGDFSDPTAVNAVARPTGPLSTPLTQSRKPTKLFGVRLEGIIGQRNFPHVDFLKVPVLGSASTADLKEATLGLLSRVNEKEGEFRDVSEYITVFLFTYADLIGSSQSVFGLTSAVPRGMLMFTPATNMKVLARHLEDDELTRELDRVSGGPYRRMRPDVCACARVLVQYVSRFSREKRIPIVIFLGEKLIDVFPRKRVSVRNAARVQVPAAESLFQRPPNSPFR